MNRKMSICTLCASSAQNAADYLKQRASAYSPDVAVKDFDNASAFAAGVDSCALEGGVILAAAPLSEFLKAKIRLIKTVSDKIVRSNSIAALLNEKVPAYDAKEAEFNKLHAAIPEKAKTLKSADGRYSAFVKEHKKSLIVFLPLDEPLLNYMFSAGLAKMLDGIFPKAQPQAAVPSEKPRISVLREQVETVMASGKSVAVSPCGCAKPLISAISTVPGCEMTFVQDNALRDRLPDESIENYVAQCAKISKENAGTDLGISVSSIYKDRSDDSDFVIVCVADSDRAKAAKVYANPGEDKKHLVAAAVIRLCEMLGELSGPEGLVNPDVPVVKPKKWAKNPKLPIIITVAGIALAVIIGLVLAFVLGGEKEGEQPVSGNGIYDFAQQDYYADVDYHGGSNIDYLEMQAIAVQNEQTTYNFGILSTSETIQQTSVTETLTQIVTTIKNVVTTNKPTTTKKLTTTAKATTTVKPTTTKATTTLKPTTTKATTTLKPTTTTTKATTTLKPTTTLVSSTSTTVVSGGKVESTTAGSSKGVFVFKTYGWGHGVGMSQYGAIQMAKDGKDYEEILTHYFEGTTVKTDSATPLTVKYGGKDIPIVEYLCRTTYREIGDGAPLEALKAQAVTAYTFAKFYDFDVESSKHAYSTSYEYAGTNIHKAVLAVLGMSSDIGVPKAKYVDYNGSAAFTCYFATAAGKTASSASVWGGNGYPYLDGGAVSPETVKVSEETITADEMKKLILSYAKDNDIEITLSENPAEWLEIVSHDSSMNANTGYVTTMRVGNKEVRGNTFRCYVLDFKIDSHCFTFEYIP
ncbi:MAG: hypothetical protein IKW12_04905 [Clostridia bacterium]|nr:hypothetical protein [Clostridia bacterium]